MSKHDGHRNRKPVASHQIGVAHSNSDHTDTHLVFTRRGNFDLFNAEGTTDLSNQSGLGTDGFTCCAHLVLLLVVSGLY